MNSPRSQFIKLIEQGAVPVEKIGEALKAAKIAPEGKAWLHFMDQLLLWLGGLALSFAVVFFFAYNWNDIGRFAKFGMVEGAVVLSIVAYCRFRADSLAGKVSLLAATICVGALLALYGQTYQTGADSWELFFTWALLMLPWAIIGRFAAIWIVWAGLMNTAIVLYHRSFPGIIGFLAGPETGMLWMAFIFNTFLLSAWELLAEILHWLKERWAIRLLATGSGVPLTWLVLNAIFDRDRIILYPALAWALWLSLMVVVYRKKKPDLFMLAGCCLSGITVAVSFLGKHMLNENFAGGFLLIALVVIGMGAGAAIWLKNIHREWQS